MNLTARQTEAVPGWDRHEIFRSPEIVQAGYAKAFAEYADDDTILPLLLQGDALHALPELPAESIDCVITSPPYWGKREYADGGVGLEDHYQEFVLNLAAVFGEVKRALKPGGSLWLNLGDSYQDKKLVGIP